MSIKRSRNPPPNVHIQQNIIITVVCFTGRGLLINTTDGTKKPPYTIPANKVVGQSHADTSAPTLIRKCIIPVTVKIIEESIGF